MTWTDVFTAWGEPASARRAEILAAHVAEHVHYADPHSGPVDGRKSLAAVIEGFRSVMPDGSATGRDADGYEGHARAAVDFARGGQTFMTGQYFAEFDTHGRIKRLVGFAGPPTP